MLRWREEHARPKVSIWVGRERQTESDTPIAVVRLIFANRGHDRELTLLQFEVPKPANVMLDYTVWKSPDLDEGQDFELDSAQLTIGRGRQNDIAIGTDEYASARHARFEPRQDGVWVQDLGSTNGTYLNGTRLERPRRLAQGDVVRVGETDLRFEP